MKTLDHCTNIKNWDQFVDFSNQGGFGPIYPPRNDRHNLQTRLHLRIDPEAPIQAVCEALASTTVVHNYNPLKDNPGQFRVCAEWARQTKLFKSIRWEPEYEQFVLVMPDDCEIFLYPEFRATPLRRLSSAGARWIIGWSATVETETCGSREEPPMSDELLIASADTLDHAVADAIKAHFAEQVKNEWDGHGQAVFWSEQEELEAKGYFG
jgi:hypothetical protein